MTLQENESIEASVRGKKERDILSAENVTKANILIRGAVVIGASIVGVTIWVGSLKSDIKDLRAENKVLQDRDVYFDGIKKERDAQFKAIEIYENANEKVLTERKVLLEALRRDIDETKEVLMKDVKPKVDYIESLRRFGISNKEDYIREHGVAAPSNPAAGEGPKK